MSRAAVMAVESERNRVAQAARDAEIARVEAEREKLEQSCARRIETMDRKEHEAERRERERERVSKEFLEAHAAAAEEELSQRREAWVTLRVAAMAAEHATAMATLRSIHAREVADLVRLLLACSCTAFVLHPHAEG